MDKQTVAENLRAERARRGMSQATLADMSGVSIAAIGRYERAESDMTLPTAASLAKALGCSISLLAGVE